ncbi:MAG: tRNA pseudouridine(38-40) synthase TruA [Gemmatimonadota bacterium]|jgi:tRNA pseudouridine38-40 synthase|nr:tRNA pseudouridine(38-40) synthase TruA [Gemmatimonadota bacterium]
MTSEPDQRIAFTVHYDGRAFHGWQLQPTDPSVQGELERVLSRLFNRPARVTGSGRTDRGVHATGQVASVDAPASWTAPALRRAMNALLPSTVWIAHAEPVTAGFHPRFDAVARSYIYHVGLAESTASPFHSPWCWPLRRPLDLELMREASATLVGEHSFRAFAKAGQEERGDHCIVASAEWVAWEGLGLEFRITANRFLHHMVRYLVGTLVEIGRGGRPEEDIVRMLAGEPGVETSPPAPSEGLFLAAVRYPPGAYSAPDTGSSGADLENNGRNASLLSNSSPGQKRSSDIT